VFERRDLGRVINALRYGVAACIARDAGALSARRAAVSSAARRCQTRDATTRGEDVMRTGTLTIPTALFLALGIPTIALAQAPSFDVGRGCKTAGDNEKAQQTCLRDEQGARDLLNDRWSQFAAADRTNCIKETSSDNTPSYVELLVCLQMADDVKKLPKKDVDFAPYPSTKK
jgi:hypothetical protein